MILADVILDPYASHQAVLDACRRVTPGSLIYHGPLFVRQRNAEAPGVGAVLPFDPRHTGAIAAALSGMDERVNILFTLAVDEPVLDVHTDCVYHPYQDYVLCVDRLAGVLADVEFSFGIEHEDDEGNRSYIVDDFTITGGTLRGRRRLATEEEIFADNRTPASYGSS